MRGAPVTVLCASGSDQIWTWIRKRAESDPGPTALGPSSQRGWVFLRKPGPWAPSQPTDWSPPRKLERREGERQVPGYLPQGQTGPETTGSGATFWPQAGPALPCSQAPRAHIWGPCWPPSIFPPPARGLGSLPQGRGATPPASGSGLGPSQGSSEPWCPGGGWAVMATRPHPNLCPPARAAHSPLQAIVEAQAQGSLRPRGGLPTGSLLRHPVPPGMEPRLGDDGPTRQGPLGPWQSAREDYCGQWAIRAGAHAPSWLPALPSPAQGPAWNS